MVVMHKDGKVKRLQQSLEGLKNDLRLCIGERTMRLSEKALCIPPLFLGFAKYVVEAKINKS
jgi:hypothetical protein